MIRPSLRGLRALLCSLFVASFVSCSSTGSSMLPAGLADALGSVTGLTSKIGDWKSSLSGALDSTGLGKLKEYATGAGDLANSLNGYSDKLGAAMKDPMKAITGKLTEMSGLDVDKLKNLAPTEQMKAIEGFSKSAESTGGMVNEFMKKFAG